MTRVISTLATLITGACQWWAGVFVLILVGWAPEDGPAGPSSRTEDSSEMEDAS